MGPVDLGTMILLLIWSTLCGVAGFGAGVFLGPIIKPRRRRPSEVAAASKEVHPALRGVDLAKAREDIVTKAKTERRMSESEARQFADELVRAVPRVFGPNL